ASGTPNNIHFANDNSIPYILSIAPANNVFGGVPINVATPPTEAEYAIPSISALPIPKFSFDVSILLFGSCSSASDTRYIIAKPLGTLIVPVAVLEIYMGQ